MNETPPTTTATSGNADALPLQGTTRGSRNETETGMVAAAATDPPGVTRQECGKCKKVTDTKPCFAPNCGKPRCVTCVQKLCKKNNVDELKDEDGKMIAVCTKVLVVALLPLENSSRIYLTIACTTLSHRNAMKKQRHCWGQQEFCGPWMARMDPTIPTHP